MKELVDSKKLFLVGGPGGVGKTTLAAALAIQLAARGHRTVVLTVDPARRLAQALGFRDGFQQDLQAVKIPGIEHAELHASMLDTQRHFDRIIEKFATKPQQRERILNNPLYKTMVESLGGTHEYAAMERLLEFASDPRFDRIVVDTPPSQNAVDLLSAPQRLADFMDNSVLKWFQGSTPVLSLFKTGTKLAMKMVRSIFGVEFMDRLGSFFDDLEGMQAGFRNRNLEVVKILQSPQTAFLLTTVPSEARYQESLAFLDSLKLSEVPLSGVILNRVEPECPAAPSPTDDESVRRDLTPLFGYYHEIYGQQQHWVEKFRKAVPHLPLKTLPRVGAVHDMASLYQLGQELLS